MLQVENTLFTIVMISYFASMVLYFIYIAAKKEIFSKIAFALQAFGFVLHTVAIVCRGIGAGRLPLTNQYEFATSFAWGLCLLGMIFILRFNSASESVSGINPVAVFTTRSFIRRPPTLSSDSQPPCSPWSTAQTSRDALP